MKQSRVLGTVTRRWSVLCLVVLSFACIASAQNDDFEKAVLADEARVAKAWNAHDSATINQLFDDEFRGITSRGRTVVKKDILQAVKLNSEGSTEIAEQHVAIWGDTAVYTALVTDRFKPAKGAPTVLRTRVTNIWVRREGKNICVASQETRIP